MHRPGAAVARGEHILDARIISPWYHDSVARSRIAVRLAFIGVPVVLVAAVLLFLIWRQSVPGVRAELSPAPKFIGLKSPLTLNLLATRGGVRSMEVVAVQGSTRAVVAQQTFPEPVTNQQRVALTVSGKDLGLHEGPATLEVVARDGFWRPIRRDAHPIATVP